MSIKETYKHLRDLVAHIAADLDKSENGNKAASQRVRTGTVKLEKVAKLFRKESIAHEKKTKGHKPAKASAKKAVKKPAAKAPAKKPEAKKHAVVKAKPKAKAVHHAKPRHFAVKKSTAKKTVAKKSVKRR